MHARVLLVLGLAALVAAFGSSVACLWPHLVLSLATGLLLGAAAHATGGTLAGLAMGITTSLASGGISVVLRVWSCLEVTF